MEGRVSDGSAYQFLNHMLLASPYYQATALYSEMYKLQCWKWKMEISNKKKKQIIKKQNKMTNK